MEKPVTSNLIAASAGTGKTYKLASRFISLLALGYPAERLIALTFTRNAAGEFKGRILSDLARGASSEAEAARLCARINETLHGSGVESVPLCPAAAEGVQLSCASFRAMLAELIAKLPKLNLSTMDSFFSKLVSSHCFELGFASIEQMDDATLAKLRRAALYSILVENTEDEEEALLELFQDVTGASKRDVFTVLEENVAGYYTLYQDTQARAGDVWGQLAVFGFEDEQVLRMVEQARLYPSAEVRAFLQTFLDDNEQAIAKLMGDIEEQGGKLNRYAKNGCLDLVKNLRKGKLELSGKTCEWLYGDSASCPGEVQLRQVVRHTRDMAILLPIALRTRGILRLMERYDSQYKEDVRSTGKLVFDDMPRLLAGTLLDALTPSNIAYRLDGRLDHWMLDEFQDTSPEQWKALRPLLEEIRDEIYSDPAERFKCAPRSLFVVGDEKQSIYGWRGATPELFSYLKRSDLWNRALLVSPQNESQRSADAIMGAARVEHGVRLGFVNELFAGVFAGQPGRLEEFAQHRIAPRNSGMPGYVRVESCVEDAEAELTVREVMCERMREILLHETDFMRGGLSAAILVRSNSEVREICRWFREHARELPVAPLADEPVGAASFLGELFLHFFKWLQHPSDAFRENLLTVAPLHVVQEGESPAQAWKRWRKLLEAEGFVAVLYALSSREPGMQQDRSFREWVDAARGFDAAGGSLAEWTLHMGSFSTKANPPKSYIHIMTFHKSKGAEYDLVLLPFAGVQAVNERVSFHKKIMGRGDDAEIAGVLVAPKVADKEAPNSPYHRLTREWKAELKVEALNVLYVAVTRAKHANYILLNANGGRKKPHADSFSDIITKAVGGSAEWGTPQWHAAARGAVSAPAEEPSPRLAPARDRRQQVSPSKVGESGEGGAPVVSGAAADADAADFGTRVHALFEQVEWLGGGEEPAWLAEPRSAEERLVAAALRVPQVRSLFTRQPGQVAYTEQPIDAIEGEKWISGTIDRLVLTHKDNQVVAADIVDFKTDRRRGDSPAEQDAHLCCTHGAQMKLYRELIAAAFELPVEAVRVTLISCPRDGAPARAVPWSSRS